MINFVVAAEEIFKIIYLKKEILKAKKLDHFKYNPCFIKIDITLYLK